jgi:hypothetical protein
MYVYCTLKFPRSPWAWVIEPLIYTTHTVAGRLGARSILPLITMSQALFPGPTQPYAPSYNYNNNISRPQGDLKDPYAGDRFKPKKKVNDPILLVFFILQVRTFLLLFAAHLLTMSWPVTWVRRSIRHNSAHMDFKRRLGRRTRKGGRADWPSCNP